MDQHKQMRVVYWFLQIETTVTAIIGLLQLVAGWRLLQERKETVRHR